MARNSRNKPAARNEDAMLENLNGRVTKKTFFSYHAKTAEPICTQLGCWMEKKNKQRREMNKREVIVLGRNRDWDHVCFDSPR